jgi:hypothetical protein
MKSEYSLITVLMVSQLILIGIVVALVASPWYSVYFNQGLKERALDSYRIGSIRTTTSADLAKIFHKPGLDSAIELHADEQIALESIGKRTGNLKQIVATMRHHVEGARNRSDTAGNIADIALLKLIRVELAAAELYFDRRSYSRARELVTAAIEDLKRQNALFQEEPQRFNLEKIFDLTRRINRAEGDSEGAARAEALLGTLSNPIAAREWFKTHGMKGFEGSYPTEFLIKVLLSTGSAGSKASDTAQALELCKRFDVNPSTRTRVMQTAINQSDSLPAPSLAPAVANCWFSHCSKNPIRFKPEAILAYSLKSYVVRHGSEKQFVLICSKIEESIEKNLLPKEAAQAYFDGYESDQMYRRRWPPRTEDGAKLLAQDINRLISMCHKSGCDDLSLQLSLGVALVNSFQVDSAEALICKLLPRVGALHAPFNEPYQVRLSNLIPGIASNIGREHSPASYARVCRLIDRALQSCQWSDVPRLRILQTSYDYIAGADKALQEQRMNEIFAINKRLNAANAKNLEFDFFILNNIVITKNRTDDGNRMLEEIRNNYGEKSLLFADLSQRLLGYRRAYPSYSPETLKICREKPFPAKLFESTPNLVARISGKKTARYVLCLLWLAEFEYCRGNSARAAEICDEILSTERVESMAAYWSALDLRAQVLGEKQQISSGQLRGVRDTNLELLCLSNIYSQLGKLDAAARVDALRKRMKE